MDTDFMEEIQNKVDLFARGQFKAAMEAEGQDADCRRKLQLLRATAELFKQSEGDDDDDGFAEELKSSAQLLELVLDMAAEEQRNHLQSFMGEVVKFVKKIEDAIHSLPLMEEDCCDLEEELCEEGS